MIENIWSGKNKLYWLLIPLSIVYGVIVYLRYKLYKIGVLPSWKAPIPVIIVGNLSVGGNGKTPLVVCLVEQLKKQGYRVGIVSRGYGGKSEHYPLLLDAETSPEQAGDEPVLIYQRTQVPLAVAPKRSDAVKALLKQHSLDLIITDDGLQHYALQRDIEIVVVDAKRKFGNGWWLPAGPLRERTSRLKRTDLIIINGQLADNIVQLEYMTANSATINTAAINNPMTDDNTKIYSMQLKTLQAVNLLTQERAELSSLPSICAIAGISNPQRFFDTLSNLQVVVQKTFPFADHQKFSLELLAGVANSDETLLMTEKDAVKCKAFAQVNWWYLPIDAIIPQQAIERLLTKIKQINKE